MVRYKPSRKNIDGFNKIVDSKIMGVMEKKTLMMRLNDLIKKYLWDSNPKKHKQVFK